MTKAAAELPHSIVWCGARGCVKMNAESLDERYAFWNGG
jgi:hypothetical protein